MTDPLSFQSIILKLQQFWADWGCVIWQPYHTEVGAGTMNPATALRVLGPEPWNVAYVEPSIRPDDGRYGENPNRLQHFYQFQVIMKPDPGNPQEVYLDSLKALGIDPHEHDIRFVEDNWESPPLGAWGLGWEVWLDGQEISQFTYFQQSGGVSLEPVSVEITYGLERIAIALQRKDNFRDVRWVGALTYGDVYLQNEFEQSRYYFDIADVDRLHQLYDLFEAEAKVSLEAGLVLPAHDYLLKCSHTFNVLDARGAIGVTERQAFFARMRDLTRRVSEAYLDQRQRLEYPWIEAVPAGNTDDQRVAAKSLETATCTKATPFLLEIGTEELPPGDIETALAQLQARVPAMLARYHLDHGEIKYYSTPRRLAVLVDALAPGQPDQEVVFRGPPAARAFDALGEPTRAAEGFARSKGMSVQDLEIREMNGGRYAVAVVAETGRPAVEVLAETLPELIASLRFGKSMRWNATNVAFSRPIRWLLALHGEGVIPFEYAGLQSGNTTRSLRFWDPEEIRIQTPGDYFPALQAQGILLDVQDRQQAIQSQVTRLAAEVGGTGPDDPALLLEVTHLVEAPTALRGSFDEAYLKLPREVLVSVMKKHQRYFPVEREGALLPYFIAVRNGDDRSLEVVREGNEHVIRARFADADFFVSNDLKHSLEDHLPRLATLRFQAKLGSMLDKTKRLEALVEALIPMAGLQPEAGATARRAAHLCKADLVTEMVIEMTSLQGSIGRYYALRGGEPEAVAEAIFEHYLPRFAGDAGPRSQAGLVVGLADRLDSLTGLFAAGLAPTGNKDPFGLRRAALGLVSNLIAWDMDFDLRPALEAAAGLLPIPSPPESRAEVLNFIAERLRGILRDGGYRYDVVDAVIAAQGHNPSRAAKAVAELAGWVRRDDWHTILPAYARCVRITRELPSRFPVDPGRFVESASRELYAALLQAEKTPRKPGSAHDLLEAFVPMIPAINRFFDHVLVMAEDEALRENRLGMLQRVAGLADGVADLSRLEGF